MPGARAAPAACASAGVGALVIGRNAAVEADRNKARDRKAGGESEGVHRPSPPPGPIVSAPASATVRLSTPARRARNVRYPTRRNPKAAIDAPGADPLERRPLGETDREGRPRSARCIDAGVDGRIDRTRRSASGGMGVGLSPNVNAADRPRLISASARSISATVIAGPMQPSRVASATWRSYSEMPCTYAASFVSDRYAAMKARTFASVSGQMRRPARSCPTNALSFRASDPNVDGAMS